jgi:hypothetical protein
MSKVSAPSAPTARMPGFVGLSFSTLAAEDSVMLFALRQRAGCTGADKPAFGGNFANGLNHGKKLPYFVTFAVVAAVFVAVVSELCNRAS